MDHLYSEFTAKRLYKLTDKIIHNKHVNYFFLYLSFQTEINDLVDRFYEFLNSTEYMAFWCKITICLNIISLKNFIFDLFKLKSPGFIRNIPTNIEQRYVMEKVICFCENEDFWYKLFLFDNFNFYNQFCNTYQFKQVEIDELKQFMTAFLDIKTCCNVLMLYFRE